MKSDDTYKFYSQIYDDFKGDRSANVRLLTRLIEKHKPDATSLLELACGTGSIAQGLSKSYIVTGLDNSKHMLQIAKTKLPPDHLIRGDMASFELSQKFDVIYCVHNSMNHLDSFGLWEAVFERVHAHLHKNGVFIFDFNPVDKMERLSRSGSFVRQIGKHYVVSQVTKKPYPETSYGWHVKLFLNQKGDKYVLKHSVIHAASYPFSQVTTALSRCFSIAESFVLEQSEMADDVGRAYYVCVKK